MSFEGSVLGVLLAALAVPVPFRRFALATLDVAKRISSGTGFKDGTSVQPGGCESESGSQNGTLVKGTKDQNLRSPAGFILTHTHVLKGHQGGLSNSKSSMPRRLASGWPSNADGRRCSKWRKPFWLVAGETKGSQPS